MSPIYTAILLLALWNVAVFALYGLDKRKAVAHTWRISEKTLLATAFCMGSLGALLGMKVFRHKIRHTKFMLCIPLFFVLHVAALIGVAYAYTSMKEATLDMSNATSVYQKITPQQAQALMQVNHRIVDVRTPEEYAEGHIPGAILLPDTEIALQAETLLPDKDQPILVYCRSGRRSAAASQALLDMGYTHVYDFGGILDWDGAIMKP